MRLAIEIDVGGADPGANRFEMHRGTNVSRALEYFDYCRAPRSGSITLVELDGTGRVRRILAHKSGVRTAP